MNFRLLWLIIRRQRKIPGFGILFFALLISIFSVTLVSNMGIGIKKIFLSDAARLLGADVVLESSGPFPPHLIDQNKVKTTESIHFLSMISDEKGAELASIAAIGETFPIRGVMVIETSAGRMIKQHAPLAGEVWVEEGVLLRLGRQLNDVVKIGSKHFVITGIIRERPIISSDVGIFAPLIYINKEDIPAMEVLRPGSRATYRLLLAGTPIALNELKMNMAGLLAEGIKWIAPQSERTTINRMLTIAQRYVGVVLFIQILLAGIAIAITAWQYGLRLQKDLVLWQHLGATRQQVILYHGLAYVVLSLSIVFISIFLAYGVSHQAAMYMTQWSGYPISLNTEGGKIGIGLGIILLGGLGLPSLLAVRRRSWYVLVVLLLYFFFSRLVEENEVALKLSSQFMVCGLLAFLLIGIIWNLLIRGGRQGGLVWRLAISYFRRYRDQAVLQCLVFTIAMSGLLLIYILQCDFIKSWKAQLPLGTPNYFLINIQANELKGVKQWLEDKNVKETRFYPIVRANLTKINDSRVTFYRSLNITWMKALPEDNQVVEHWKGTALPGEHTISIENGFAHRQDIHLGDILTFEIEEQTIQGRVIELRIVEWESLKPNFFVIFPPGVLEKYNHSYIAGVYFPLKQKIPELIAYFPSISVVDIDFLLSKMRDFSWKLGFVLTGLMGLVGILGILMMYAGLLSTLQEREHESALLRVLGAQRWLLGKVIWVEFSVLGGVSGLLGGIIAIGISHYLAGEFFDVSFVFHLKWMLIALIGGSFIIPLFGILGVRSIFFVSPLRLLRGS